MKKFTSIILSVVLILNFFCAMSITVSAEITDGETITEVHTSPIEEPTGEPDESGMLGENVWYKFYNNGTLVIGGEGETDYFVSVSYDRDDNPIYDSSSPLKNREDIKKVIIKEGVTSIFHSLFGCKNIECINIPKSFSSHSSLNLTGLEKIWDCYYNGDINDFIKIDKYDWETSPYNLYIQKELATKVNVSFLDASRRAFKNCNSITSAEILDGTKSIPYETFYGCKNLSSVIIPNSVTSIQSDAFNGCQNLESIKLPNNLISIGYTAFENCGNLAEITIPENVTKIEGRIFKGCDKLKIINYNAVSCKVDTLFGYKDEYIDEEHGSIKSELQPITLNIGKSVESISGYWGYFNENSIVNISDLTSWCNIDFYSSNPLCSINNLYINNTPATEISIPNSIYSINSYTFNSCTNIKKIILSENVKTIGESAFAGCKNLTEISLSDSLLSIGEGAFSQCEKLEKITIPEHVETIGNYAFESCESLTKIVIPNSVTSLGKYYANGGSGWEFKSYPATFKDCSSLKEVVLGTGIKEIGEYCFYNCTSLEKITIGENVESIKNSVFKNCSKIKNITIPDGVKSIGNNAFSGCTNLTNINIPNSVVRLGDEYRFSEDEECNVFDGCTNLTSIKIGTSVTELPYKTFYGCNALENIIIPDNVNKIGYQAFWNCYNLKSITILNPECDINSAYETISGTATIYGYKNSTAQTYALNCNRKFVEISGADDPIIPTTPNTETTQPTEPTSVDSWVVVKAPTCDESGVKVNYSAQESRIIPALGHKLKTVNKKAATYFAKGYTGDKKCTVCGKVISKGKTIAKLKLGTPKVKITAGKKKLMVKYTKVKNATGFQVKYTYKGKTKTKTYSTKKSVTKVINKLKKGTYKVSVRALIKSKGRTAYSNWTKAKKYKVK